MKPARSSPIRSALTSIALLLAVSTQFEGAEFFVAEKGRADGDGSEDRPWDLATALAHPKSIQPGDTIWLRPGVYRGGFKSTLKGAPRQPITVRGGDGRV